MIKNSSDQKGSVRTIVLIVMAVVVFGVLGIVFWHDFISTSGESAPWAHFGGTNAKDEQGIKYKTYQTDTHKITFEYPESWSLGNPTSSNQHKLFKRSVDVTTDKKSTVTFSVGVQGLGGLCGGVPPIRSTIDVVPTSIKSVKPTALSFTVTQKKDGSYDARYGLTDKYTTVGDTQVCSNTFYYVFSPSNTTYTPMSFSGAKHFATLNDARNFLKSDEYGAIKKMILTLSY